jgi:transcriptional regulator GlxA family with amidase domain
MSASIERVAQSTGFRDPERMRRAFGQPPQSLRRAARAG